MYMGGDMLIRQRLIKSLGKPDQAVNIAMMA
jgi:hypothetical protein